MYCTASLRSMIGCRLQARRLRPIIVRSWDHHGAMLSCTGLRKMSWEHRLDLFSNTTPPCDALLHRIEEDKLGTPVESVFKYHTTVRNCQHTRALCEFVLLFCSESELLSCSNSPSWPSRSRCLVSVVTHAHSPRLCCNTHSLTPPSLTARARHGAKLSCTGVPPALSLIHI